MLCLLVSGIAGEVKLTMETINLDSGQSKNRPKMSIEDDFMYGSNVATAHVYIRLGQCDLFLHLCVCVCVRERERERERDFRVFLGPEKRRAKDRDA